MNENQRDLLNRIVKTFFEAAIPYLLAALSGINFGNGEVTQTVLIGIALSAAAAGVSAVWNGVIDPMFKAIPEPEPQNPPSDDFSKYED